MKLSTTTSKILHKKISYFLIIFIGICVKIYLLPVAKSDFNGFLTPWMEFIKSHGYEHSLKYTFYDYTPSYIYLLVLITKLGLNPLYSIKFISIFFEYLAGFFVGKIAYLKYKSNLVILASLAIVPILPSILLNASYLSQCDSIYSALALGSIYFILSRKQFISVIFLGLAFAFKLQTIFILPLFFVLMLRNNIKWYLFAIIPLIYVISILPAWFYGRSFLDLLGIYVVQSGEYEFLTLNFPNLYIFIDNNFYSSVKILGVSVVIALTLLFGFIFKSNKYNFSFESWIRFAFLSSIVIPFLLPGMHERYMYLGDVLGVLYFLVVRKNIHLPIGILIISLYCYVRCSRFNDIMPMWPAFIIYLSVIIFTTIDFVTALNKESNDAISQK